MGNTEFLIDVHKLPKADLHVHLNGAVPTEVVRQLLHDYKVSLPLGFDVTKDLQILSSVNNLTEYFKPWRVFKRIPLGYRCLQLMVDSALRKLSEDNVKYVELRNSPFYIGYLNEISIEETLSWLIETITLSSKLHGIDARLIISLTRHELDLFEADKLLKAIHGVNRNKLIVGVDLSGDENYLIPEKEVARFFRKAKYDYGLGVTIHAGETGDYKNIVWAVESCKADRIGHGLAAVDNVKVLNLVKEKDVCIEVPLVSNLRTGYIKSLQEHPLKKFLDYDIPFVLCSDNPSVHNVTLSDEYKIFLKQYKRPDIIQRMYQRQMFYSFFKGGEIFEKETY